MLLGVHELAGSPRPGETYVTGTPWARGSPSPASRSASCWSGEEDMSPRAKDATPGRRLAMSILYPRPQRPPRHSYCAKHTQIALVRTAPCATQTQSGTCNHLLFPAP